MSPFQPFIDQVVVEDGQIDYSFNPLSLGDIELQENNRENSLYKIQRPKICLKFEDIVVNVKTKAHCWSKEEEIKNILKNVSGQVQSGQLLAILGPSGSGKTTLLNVLAGRVSASNNLVASGSVTINGKKRESSSFKKLSAYVMQDDNMFPELTVKEQIAMSAKLRLPNSLDKSTKQRRVEQVISELGLSTVKNSFIGSETKRGISGGERKRVSIGIELVTDPSLLFLDEPTSGLDAFNAQNVVQTLIRLAKKWSCSGDDCQVIYFGAAKDAISYFSRLGYQCPEHYNPADYFLDLISIDARNPQLERNSEARVSYLSRTYEEMSQVPMKNEQSTLHSTENEQDVQDKLKETSFMATNKEQMSISFGQQGIESIEKYSYPYLGELIVLFVRGWKLLIRERLVTAIRLIQTLIFAILLGLIWLNKGRNVSSQNYQAIEGILFFILINQSFVSIFGTVFAFPLERSIVLRERASGMYRVSAYYLTKTFAELPRSIILSLVFCTILYWMVGLRDDARSFFLFLVVVFLTSLTAEALALTVSAGAPTPQIAAAIIPLFLVISLLFGGFFLSNAQIPNYFVWLKYMSFIKYSFGALMHIQFDGFTFQLSTPSCSSTGGVCDGNNVLQASGTTDFSLGGNIGLLVTILVIFRVAAYLVLRITGPKFDKTL
eukprot:jgi/Galph1/3472/GphlegSOOS_G2149.1